VRLPWRECTRSAAKDVRTSGGSPTGPSTTIAGVASVPRVAGRALAALLFAAGLGGVACSRQSGPTHAPAACTGGSAGARVAAFRAALVKAPRPVALADGTRISDCLANDIDSGDLETVGSMLLTITQKLADATKGASPAGALTQLGYLIGAAHRGAARSQGVDDELVRRLEQELQDVDVSSPAYRSGERAGRVTG
jgi:hypothetical protein